MDRQSNKWMDDKRKDEQTERESERRLDREADRILLTTTLCCSL